jgi:hypothetical protein
MKNAAIKPARYIFQLLREEIPCIHTPTGMFNIKIKPAVKHTFTIRLHFGKLQRNITQLSDLATFPV